MTRPATGSENCIKKMMNSCSLGRGVGLFSDIKGVGVLVAEYECLPESILLFSTNIGSRKYWSSIQRNPLRA